MRPAIEYIRQNYTEPMIGLEIGVNKGDNAEHIYNTLSIKKLYLVDPWDERAYYIKHGSSLVGEQMYQFVLKRLGDKEDIVIIKKPSLEAVKDLDVIFDFIYVDGDHSYEEVKKDLNAWYPKVKEGGVFCGDDYQEGAWQGVIDAVNEFAEEKKKKLHLKDFEWWIVK